MYYDLFSTDLGEIIIAGDDEALRHLDFLTGKRPVHPAEDWVRDPLAAKPFRDQVLAYFAGELTSFEINAKPRGTPFQEKVWALLLDIPYGETISYGTLAARTGDPNASRAVGSANGRNPISIVVPCHRVVGANGKLTGYGGGLEKKEFLLDLERRVHQGGYLF